MDRKLNIIPGEAPESDDEELHCKPSITVLQGTAVAGEAPESDSSESDIDAGEGNEQVGSIGSVSSAASVLSLLSPSPESGKTNRVASVKESLQYNSLLHKKLRERNTSLRRSVDDFVHHTVEGAAKDLNSIDQHLLKSQVTLQEATTSLRLLQSNLSHIHSKLSTITSSVYVPVINTESL